MKLKVPLSQYSITMSPIKGVRVIDPKSRDKAFFVYGFAKSARANISADELKAFKKMASELLSYCGAMLEEAIDEGKLFEVMPNE